MNMEIERELIAERTIYAIDKDSQGFEIKLMIGKPYQLDPVDSLNNIWACPVAARGWYRVPESRGIDSWQALMIARNMLARLLAYFVQDGGKLYWEKNGEELDIDHLFGVPVPRPEPQLPMTREEYQQRIEALTADELQTLDEALMAGTSKQFRKVARVIGIAMEKTRQQIPRVPDGYFAIRVQKLVKEGRLVSQGNLKRMRFSEIRLPDE